MKKTVYIVQAAMIAALYVALTYLAGALGLASGSIQFRISEALTVLPYFFTSAIPGLSLGCLISNIIVGSPILDVVVGTVATFLGAVGSWHMATMKGKWVMYLVPAFPVFSNTILVSLVIKAYYLQMEYMSIMIGVLIGEVVCCGVLGLLLFTALRKARFKPWVETMPAPKIEPKQKKIQKASVKYKDI